LEVTEVGWDKGRYYTRSKKVNGRVRREYVGSGPVAQLAAQLDAIKRQERQAERAARIAIQEEMQALEAPLTELNDLTNLIARAALLATGYHQHHRGEWRKRREQAENDR
jgi:hypothetical protein